MADRERSFEAVVVLGDERAELREHPGLTFVRRNVRVEIGEERAPAQLGRGIWDATNASHARSGKSLRIVRSTFADAVTV